LEVKWSASCPSCFILGDISPSTLWKGGWVGLRAGLDMVAKRKIPAIARNQTLVILPVA